MKYNKKEVTDKQKYPITRVHTKSEISFVSNLLKCQSNRDRQTLLLLLLRKQQINQPMLARFAGEP